MATKARQQYFADETSLQKQSREFSIADEIQQKIDSVEEWAQVNKIDTIKVNWDALVPDIAKAVNVEVPDVIDNLYTIAADDALSAKQWKILYDYIQNLQTIGRFLSNWDTATWLPITNPSESPYLYKAWDYYRVSNVAVSPASNYKPDGSSYIIWAASTTVETLSVAVSDLYLYDGTDWILLSNSWSGIAVDSSLSTTSTNPVENRVITNALNWKHPWEISNVAPSNPVEWMLWYDTVNDELKTYNWTAWTTEWTKMVVLEYGVSTWQNFIDAYNENAIVYCRVTSWSSGYRMAFMAYTAWQWTPTEVEFQYYRSRSSHSQSSTQLDEVYVYKLTNAWVWTTTQRDTWAEMIAGTWIWITFDASGATISNSWVTSVNWNTWAVTLDADDISDSATTNKFVTATDKSTWSGKQDALTLPANPTNWNLVTRWADNETLVDGWAVPVVPTNVSAFSNDAGYITSASLPWTATSSTAWTVKLFSDTAQSESAQTVSSTAGRTYGVQLNSSNQMVVNVPRTDTQDVTSVNWNTWAVTVSEFTPWGTATTGYVVTKTANGYEWQAPSGWDVMVSSQSWNILTSWMKIWAWLETDYTNLWTYDSNTLYLTVE